MEFKVCAWQPSHEGESSAWKWYWYVDILDGRAIVGVIQQPHYKPAYETKADAEAAAQAVIDGLTKQE